MAAITSSKEILMSRRELGRASYRAYRLFGVTHLIAIGETPNLNDKVDFEQLPFRIFPPIFGFFFIHQDFRLPARKPFVYQESIIYPTGVNSIRIQDADGIHDVPIADVVSTDAMTDRFVPGSDPNYCVFSWIGTNWLLIAKCDAILPAVYTRVFGPATYEACQSYVREHGGTAGSEPAPLRVLEDTFRAWLDLMPPAPRFFVTGEGEAPSTGWSVSLVRAVPQGINPDVLILEIKATPPSGISLPCLTKIPVRYEEAPPVRHYSQVTIRYAGKEFTIGVGVVH